MTEKKAPAGCAEPTGKNAQSGINPQTDYITDRGRLTRERAHELLNLCIDFNKKCSPYITANFNISFFTAIAIHFEPGTGGSGHVENYDDLPNMRYSDLGLVNAEKRLRRLMEGRYDT